MVWVLILRTMVSAAMRVSSNRVSASRLQVVAQWVSKAAGYERGLERASFENFG